MRLFALALIIVALAAVLISEHRPPNAGLPIVNASLCGPQASHFQFKQRRIA